MTSDQKRRAKMTAGFAQMQQAAQGIFEVGFYAEAQFREIEAQAKAGDVGSSRLLASLNDFFGDVRSRATSDTPVCCMICATPFGRGEQPSLLVTLGPSVPDSGHRFVSGVCGTCCERPDLKEAIYAQYRTVLPGMRRITVGAAGHA